MYNYFNGGVMSKNTSFLKLKNVSKFYYNKGLVASGFTKVNLEFNLGEFVVITGESGSGKSTLLNVLSGLDTYEEGELYINGEETSHYGESEFEYYRKTYIGNIFQSFNLVNSYTVYQNIELVLLLNGFKKKDIKDKVLDLIKQVDLYRYRNTKVSKLSGGQKQRVAIARALAKDTPIIIADEPTGNLDSRSAESVIKTLSEVSKDKLVIIVTHNYEQVEKYATRKIVMHDGRVRDDITLKKTTVPEIKVNEYADIDLLNKLRLGLRNTFNIFTKFALLFIVFLFVVSAFLLAYASFKNAEYEETSMGYNSFFSETSLNRIVINKKDLSEFSLEEVANIKKMEYVDRIFEKDYALDVNIIIADEYDYYGNIKPISLIQKVTYGRLPEQENEAVLLYNYWDIVDESSLGKKISLKTESELPLLDDLTIVGIISSDDYNQNGFNYDSNVFLMDEAISKISDRLKAYQADTTKFTDPGSYYLEPLIDNDLPEGSIYIYEDNDYCSLYECKKNKNLTITVKDVYYEDTLDVKIADLITRKNCLSITGYEYDEYHTSKIFLNENDYHKLYDHGIRQISVYVTDEHKVDAVKDVFEQKGYRVLALKDSIFNVDEELLGILRIMKMIILIILYVVLFFISYFVIRLIENSKNVYYATIRILGASRRVIKNLITIELLTVYHLTYLLFVLIIILNKYKVLNIKFIQENAIFLELKDYILIYILLLVMSYLISYRFARKLFKSSAMKAYREEV